MHVVLICTSVLVQLHSVLTYTVLDVTEKCLRHEVMNFTLSPGVDSDCMILTIKTKYNLKCSVKFISSSKEFIMGVVEFPTWYMKRKICIDETDSRIILSDYNDNSSCHHLESFPRYLLAHQPDIQINFNYLSNIFDLQIIATTMRDPGLYSCSPETEVECIFKQNKYCMELKFTCDEIPNCGEPNSFDEDFQKCKGLGLTPFMIFCSLLMHLMTILLVISLSLTLIPKRKETFVYKFDQSMPLFDRDNEAASYEIDIVVLYAKDLKAMSSTKSILIRK